MYTLAFDCSTDACSAAVLDGSGDVLAVLTREPPLSQAEILIPLLAAVLRDAGLAWSDLGLIGVSVGPGSFTGLRIGLAAARGLRLALGLPLVGVSTAEVFAHAVAPEERAGRTVLVVIDSKRADLFGQLFSSDLIAESALQTACPEELMAGVAGPLVVVGDGTSRLPLQGRAETVCVAARRGPPDAIIVARRAVAHFVAGDGLAATPLYLRPPDVSPAPQADIRFGKA